MVPNHPAFAGISAEAEPNTYTQTYSYMPATTFNQR